MVQAVRLRGPGAPAVPAANALLLAAGGGTALLRTASGPRRRAAHCPPPSQVVLRVRSGKAPPRDVPVARRRLTIAPVAQQLCAGVQAAALPPGARQGRAGLPRAQGAWAS